MGLFESLHILWRPVVLVVLAMLVFHLPTLLYKARLALQGIFYLLFCNDKSWPKPADPESFFEGVKNPERKTIIFIRHGESTWNDTFNKGKHRSLLVFVLGYIPGLIKSLLYECYLLLTGRIDSWFYDSPLSYLGLSQVDDLARFLESKETLKSLNPTEKELVEILRGDPGAPRSHLFCSSLRRALSTMAGAFRERLSKRSGEKILVQPCLQEISRNPDTLSITPPHKQVTASWIDRDSKMCDFQNIFNDQIDMSLHIGNKPIDTNGLKRMNAFCDHVFGNDVTEDYVIVGGHSIWFRYFFRTYLPYSSTHISKTSKVVNCGTVALTLLKTTTIDKKDVYMIEPESIKVIYGGF